LGSNTAGGIYVIDEWNPVYRESLLRLNQKELEDLKAKIRILRANPNQIAKPLRKTLKGMYTVRFADRRWRLVTRICWNSHKIKLLYVERRPSVYQDLERLLRKAK
jgi:mRNA-degrading endonuclease RelE of RelBE toxin-antitoxin system